MCKNLRAISEVFSTLSSTNLKKMEKNSKCIKKYKQMTTEAAAVVLKA